MKKIATDADSAIRLLGKLPIYKQHKVLHDGALIHWQQKTMYGKLFRKAKDQIRKYAAMNPRFCEALCVVVNKAIDDKRAADRLTRQSYTQRRLIHEELQRQRTASKVSARLQGASAQ